ncbi:hypothetical protein HDU86_001376 [Geranomyces michiganensis]|nr:hypothetical protein HDU86_001376 [Geranomyces michiganensis]
MSAATTTRSEVLGLYRGILREVSKQYTPRNKNRMWHDEVVATFKSGAGATDAVDVRNRILRAKNLHAFMTSNRTHRELVERYWPVSGMTEGEKLKRTANTVGFSLPKIFGSGVPASELGGAAENVADEPLAPHVEEALKILQKSPSSS